MKAHHLLPLQSVEKACVCSSMMGFKDKARPLSTFCLHLAPEALCLAPDTFCDEKHLVLSNLPQSLPFPDAVP